MINRKNNPSSSNNNSLISSNLKDNNFDILRLFLAVSVVFSHCYVIATGKVIDTEPGMIFTQNQIGIGSIAVGFFFVISGFLISHSFINSINFGSFLKKRVLRVLPGFYVAFLTSVLIVGPLGTISRNHILGNWGGYYSSLNKGQMLLELITLQAPHAPSCFSYTALVNMINESLWTIEFEFVCYLIIPLLALCGLFRKKWIGVCFFLCSYLILAMQDYAPDLMRTVKIPDSFTRILNPVYLPRFFVYFSAGIIFYTYRRYILRKKVFVFLSFAAIIVSCAWIKCINITLPIFGSYLLFYFAYHPNIRLPNFTKHGDFSYGIYLYAWPVQQLIMLFLAKYVSPLSLFLIALPISFLAAFISWNYIEKPFLKLKNKNVIGFDNALS